MGTQGKEGKDIFKINLIMQTTKEINSKSVNEYHLGNFGADFQEFTGTDTSLRLVHKEANFRMVWLKLYR